VEEETADGTAERRAAIAMADENLPGSRRITPAGDRGYDTRASSSRPAARSKSLRTWLRITRAREGRRPRQPVAATTFSTRVIVDNEVDYACERYMVFGMNERRH